MLTLISLSLYKVVYFVNHVKNETITETEAESPTEDVKQVAVSLYITHAYLMIVFFYNVTISIVLIVGVHKVCR